ncbi:hypothetical protein, partial [Candidatus Similichlamydia epinepheli]|uniref:hypothetical protein n=1 Tax=Candidatus Similichlamydia epinepheli TaxID=1903953 RepID=UPI0013003D69
RAELNSADIFTFALRLNNLRKMLYNHQVWGLAGSTDIKRHCEEIQDLLEPISREYESNIFQPGLTTPETMFSVLRNQLRNSDLRTKLATALDELTPLSEGELNVSPEEVMLVDVFRKFDNRSDQTLSDLGDSLSAASDFLEGLNLLNRASTWNPGQNYITANGQLTDASSTDSWYSLFIEQVQLDQIEGIRKLRQIYNNNVYPANSQEHAILRKIINKIDLAESSGGFEGLVNARTISRMWEDQSFQNDLRSAIELAMLINEEGQQNVNKVLFEIKTISDATAHIFENHNQSLISIAKRINK